MFLICAAVVKVIFSLTPIGLTECEGKLMSLVSADVLPRECPPGGGPAAHQHPDFSQDDFMLKMPAIERFAVTVKEIAQLFGTKLAETELPDEADAIEFQLRSQADQNRQLKDDIRSVMREARYLLSNLEARKADGQEDRDIKQDWDTVQRYSKRASGPTTRHGDGFFEKRHLTLQQYLQLMRLALMSTNFLFAVAQMEETLEQLIGQEKEVAAVGGLRSWAVPRSSCTATNYHYVLALIIQCCNELRHHCDMLTTAIRAKLAALTLKRHLLLRLEEARRWCDEGAYLLSNQLVDKFQSKEGVQAALQDIETPGGGTVVPDVLSLEFEAILTPQLQTQIGVAIEMLSAMQGMIHNRQACLRKLADNQVPAHPASGPSA
ncbi:unnamed protein product [Coregonus sp. 'balchen']|nr:unnamed protein product [Coregonus sp. 'balchen']